MDFQEFCAQLNISEEKRYQLQPVWEKLIEGYNDTLPFYMDRAYFEKYYPYCNAPHPLEKVLPYVDEVIRIIRDNPAANLLAHVSYRGAFQLKPGFEFSAILSDPIPFFGKEYSGMFGFMISLGAYPLIAKALDECGIPEKYALDILKWMGGTMVAYGAAHDGIPGRPFAFTWIRHYIEKDLFRIGRLEYLMHPYRGELPMIYRNDQGELAVLCGEGWNFRSPQHRTGADEPVVFTSHVIETAGTITGTPCSPDGRADFEHTVTLNKAEWHPVATPWDLCPSIHIPSGCRMPFDEVKASLLEAREFFAKYFHRHVPLFSCTSWILNPAWETLIHNSNMGRFRQECYACPAPSWGPRAGMGFIFGRADVPPETLPATNTVQRAFQEASKTGQIGIGVIFVLTDDIEKLGDQYYRRKFAK